MITPDEVKACAKYTGGAFLVLVFIGWVATLMGASW